MLPKFHASLLVATILVVVSTSALQAAPIQFRMTGTIDVQYQVGPLPPGISQGAPFEAILSFDPTMPDSQPNDPNRGYYSTGGGEDNFLLLRAGETEVRSTDLVLSVGDDVAEPQQLWELRGDTFVMRDSSLLATFDFRFAFLAFQFNDPTGSAFSSDTLPDGLDVARFSNPYIEVRTFELDPRIYQFGFRAMVQSIEAVPDPASVLCLIASLPALSAFALRRQLRRRWSAVP